MVAISKTSEYRCWSNMKMRCTNKSSIQYKDYGGRGIKVCERWLHSFANFYEDMGAKPTHRHTLERIDNDGDYTPDNCRWATYKEQMRNRRMFRNNTSGIVGVSWDKTRSAWKAHIRVNGIKVTLGHSKDKEVAAQLRREGVEKYFAP